MAARLNNRLKTHHRESIKVSMLINRLTDHIVDKADMKPTQVDAAKYLISQAIGTPSSVTEISGPEGGPVELGEIIVRGIAATGHTRESTPDPESS